MGVDTSPRSRLGVRTSATYTQTSEPMKMWRCSLLRNPATDRTRLMILVRLRRCRAIGRNVNDLTAIVP